MSLVGFIEKLQKKPRYIRIQIMWVGAIIGVTIIFIFWLWSLTSLLSQSTGAKNNDKVNNGLSEIKKEMPGLWQSLSAGISSVIQTAKEDLSASPSPEAGIEEGSEASAERLPLE